MSLASRAFFAALLFAAIVPHASAQSTVSFGTTSYSFQETETTMPVRFVRSGNTSAAATLHLALRESPYPSVISHPIVMMKRVKPKRSSTFTRSGTGTPIGIGFRILAYTR